MPRLKLDTAHAARHAENAIECVAYHLERAIAYAREADAPKIIARLIAQRSAVAGARRHTQHRRARAERGQPMYRRGVQTR